ncbi:hypothetical protein [Sphingomonas sp. AX6]|uniref:hypothetical protein n=1 Tax=Sphingomonas sp. AX6 TaxID=2653171 RepID=UPI0012F24E5F|nr:hypothetical protein [Sphingomonas sp. AX6]VXC83104.1 conserved exported hypothetical protein [Sphingomonas sp. AX6]
MRKSVLMFAACLPLLSGGCIAKTAFDVVTLPVKATGQVIDWTTTSQEESDRNYGRKMRKQEAAEGREMKRRDKEAKRAARQAERDDDY